MKESIASGLLVVVALLLAPPRAGACSCSWGGPFLDVANDAPLVIRAKVLRHHAAPAPTMDVLVLETLKGGILDSGMVVQMGDGMHCRPTMDGFPQESEWVLALNGPGAKPGSGWALSHCGEYWLRMEKGEVIGSIDGGKEQVKRMPWRELRTRFLHTSFPRKTRPWIELF
jgi:hypothetical protein